MEMLVIIVSYVFLVSISTALIVWDWNTDGLDVDIDDLMVLVFISSVGFIVFIPLLGFKYLLHKVGLGAVIVFKAKK